METLSHEKLATNTETERGIGALPTDLITEILLSLPAKSIARSRIVNKHWESISRCPSFISEHLERVRKCNYPSILICDEDNCITLIESDTWEIISKAVYGVDRMSILEKSFCNGLVCLSDSKDQPMILNPTTRESLMIPKPPSHSMVYALGFDSSSEEYKVLRMYANAEKNCTWEVLTVGDTSWRQVGTTPVWDFFVGGVYVNGAVYWVVHKGEKDVYLFSFHFEEERLRYTDEIASMPLGIHGTEQLLELAGCLCMAITLKDKFLFSTDECRLIEIWLMDEATEEWCLEYTIRVPYGEDFDVCFLKEQKILLHNLSDNGLYCYDLETDVFGPKVLQLTENESCAPYAESLVTLRGL